MGWPVVRPHIRPPCPECRHLFIETDCHHTGERLVICDPESIGLDPEQDEFIRIAVMRFLSGRYLRQLCRVPAADLCGHRERINDGQIPGSIQSAGEKFPRKSPGPRTPEASSSPSPRSTRPQAAHRDCSKPSPPWALRAVSWASTETKNNNNETKHHENHRLCRHPHPGDDHHQL